MIAPVIDAASSLARKAASAATSQTWTKCLVGCACSSTSLMTCGLGEAARFRRVGNLLFDQRRPDVAGTDRVHRDALRRDFERYGLGKPAMPCFAAT